MDGRTHTQMLRCRDSIHAAFQVQADRRDGDPHWEANERMAMAGAANDWALAHGLQTVTVQDIEAIEHHAVGHIDYATKIALYIAELVYGVSRLRAPSAVRDGMNTEPPAPLPPGDQ